MIRSIQQMCLYATNSTCSQWLQVIHLRHAHGSRCCARRKLRSRGMRSAPGMLQVLSAQHGFPVTVDYALVMLLAAFFQPTGSL
jgi:hypothetical protein